MPSETRAKQIQNARKMVDYYKKEADMLRRKLHRARTADEQLARLEENIRSMESALQDEQKRGRVLLRNQKEQQRLLAAGGSREESASQLADLREDLRVGKERLRRGTESNETEARQLAEIERKRSELSEDLQPLEQQYSVHQQAAAEVRKRASAADAARESQVERKEAVAERMVAIVEAEREKQFEQRVKAKAMAKVVRAELNRMEDALKRMLDAKKRVELKAKAAQERAREKERGVREREREAAKREEREILKAKRAAEKHQQHEAAMAAAAAARRNERSQIGSSAFGPPASALAGVERPGSVSEADARATAAALAANAAPQISVGGLNRRALPTIGGGGDVHPFITAPAASPPLRRPGATGPLKGAMPADDSDEEVEAVAEAEASATLAASGGGLGASGNYEDDFDDDFEDDIDDE